MEHVDHIVYALGGTSPNNFLKTAGIDVIDDMPNLDEGNESKGTLFGWRYSGSEKIWCYCDCV
ncbi:MAG: hypothetical protein B6244_09570 [Candidatus Cloacimonetes bacterium 4572_55]|nr:MAG: hypothetical protein B6244_09570 [Candidatus Cloacimonetes bacterium 4572_55]